MPVAKEKRLPTWPLRLALSLMVVVEVIFAVKLSGEGHVENIPMIVNSVGLIVFCLLIWRGLSWGRWFLIGLLVWRVAKIGFAVASHLGPGDHRIIGTLMLATFYVAVGLLIASPLGRLRMRRSD